MCRARVELLCVSSGVCGVCACACQGEGLSRHLAGSGGLCVAVAGGLSVPVSVCPGMCVLLCVSVFVFLLFCASSGLCVSCGVRMPPPPVGRLYMCVHCSAHLSWCSVLLVRVCRVAGCVGGCFCVWWIVCLWQRGSVSLGLVVCVGICCSECVSLGVSVELVACYCVAVSLSKFL